ncbi:MAG TPA: phosphonate ABC transporter, permease protein PhnE [Pyrinomonadaceae bacterium]|nr:phosphonate ABC transporter, permease protein PhnE [Pyrinomonadaceae bacterium]
MATNPGNVNSEPFARLDGAPLLTPRRAIRLVALAAVLAFCWHFAEVRPAALLDPTAARSVWNFLRGLFPPDLSADFLRVVAAATLQTLAIAVAGSLLSVGVGLPLGILATSTLWRRGPLLEGERRGARARALASLNRLTRAVLGFLRAIPDLMWALLFVVAVGLGSLAGTLALAVSYGGVLGRVYADVFEDVDPRPLEALHASGATRAQVFLRAVWPQAAPSVAAYTLYNFECAVRAASVLGFVGAGGIGYEINLSMRLFEYGQVLTLILAFVLLMTATDALSRRLRRRLHAEVSPASPVRYLMEETLGVGARPFGQRASRVAARLRARAVVPLFLFAAACSLYAVGFLNGTLLDAGLGPRVARFVARMFPPDLSRDFLLGLLTPLAQTVGISVVGTLLGVGLGAALALPATSTLMFTPRDAAGRRSALSLAARWLAYHSARAVVAYLRAVPELVWVLVCILAVGLGPFAGTLALGLHTGGVLGKLYAETLEEVPMRPVEALRASGARPFQVFLWAMWPQARPMLTSYTVLRWEMNLRVSTVLGLVGGGGLGQAIYNNVQLGFHTRLTTLVALVYLLVLACDRVSDALRFRPTTPRARGADENFVNERPSSRQTDLKACEPLRRDAETASTRAGGVQRTVLSEHNSGGAINENRSQE